MPGLPAELGGGAWDGVPAEDISDGDPAELVVRPESLALVPSGTSGALSGRVEERRYAGPVTYYLIALTAQEGAEVEVLAPSGAAAEGDTVAVGPGTSGPAARIFKREAS